MRVDFFNFFLSVLLHLLDCIMLGLLVLLLAHYFLNVVLWLNRGVINQQHSIVGVKIRGREEFGIRQRDERKEADFPLMNKARVE